ncbi:MAG: acyltransferase family protein [Cyanobacteriota bacterium]
MAKAESLQEYSRPSPPRNQYRPEIDGLRAFAVVAVIINHFNKDLLPSGYLGVDIFFVISGYVITSSLSGRQSKNFLDFVTGFYERRIKRLVPALVVFVLITSLLICLFNPDPDLALKTGVTSLFGLSNLYLLKQSTDYFAQSTELNPFTHTWSLGVEEQFYLLFPFLIWFSGFGQQTAKGARNLFLWVGALTIASLIGFIYLYQVNQPAAYFLMPPRFWEMATGCLICIGFQKRARIEQALEQVPPLLAVAAVVGVMLLPVSAAVPATVSIVVLSAILIACLKQGTAAHRFFTLEKVVFVGLISYSLYLWHWTVLSISRWTTGIDWRTAPLQVGLILIFSSASYFLVEKPFRSASWGDKSPGAIAKRIATAGATFAGVISLSNFNGALLQIGNNIFGRKEIEDTGILQTRIYCHLPKKSSSAISDCLGGGARQGAPTIYIIGDSHASNHYPSIKEGVASIESKPQVKVLIDWGLINWLRGIDECGSYDPCIKDSGAKHLEFFGRSIRTGDIIVFSWFRDRTVVQQTRLPRKQDVEKLAILEGRLNMLASSIKSKGGKIVLADDIPMVCEPGINYGQFILRMRRFEKCSKPETVSLQDRIGMTELYKRLAAKNPRTFLYFDPHPALCSKNVCDVFDRRDAEHARILYGDGIGHFRPEYPNPLSRQWNLYLRGILTITQPRTGNTNTSASRQT